MYTLSHYLCFTLKVMFQYWLSIFEWHGTLSREFHLTVQVFLSLLLFISILVEAWSHKEVVLAKYKYMASVHYTKALLAIYNGKAF